MFSLLPFLLNALYFLKRPAAWPFLIATFYFLSLVVITMISDPEYSAPDLYIGAPYPAILRTATHVAFFFVFGLFAVLQGVAKCKKSLAVLTSLTIVMMGISVVVNGNQNEIFRVLLLALYIVNMFWLLNFNEKSKTDFFRFATVATLAIAFVSILTIFLYGNYPDWSLRLGRPLNPRVLSALATICFLFALYQWPFAAPFLLAVIVASGSRLGIAMAIIGLIVVSHDKKLWGRWISLVLFVIIVVSVVIILVTGLGSTLLPNDFFSLFARSDITAGRLKAWIVALDMLPNVWLLGQGERFFVQEGERILRLHNGALEAVVSYGIFFALPVALVYVYAYRVQTASWARLVVIYAILEFFFGTPVWTNLGDAISFLFLIAFLPAGEQNVRSVARIGNG